MKRIAAFLAAVQALAGAGGVAEAQIVTRPTALGPGEQYRLVFVTTSTLTPNPGGGPFGADFPPLVEWNEAVSNDVAGTSDLNALGVDWYAIVSVDGSLATVDVTVDARDNTLTNTNEPGHASVPIYNLNDEKIADDNIDLWDGNIDNDIRYRNDGTEYTSDIYTITDSDGTLVGGSGLGRPTATTSIWIDRGGDTGTMSRPCYGISAVITMPGGTLFLFR
jgi:hypothetical protein